MLPQVGEMIELVRMPNDPHPIPVGTKGVVINVGPDLGDGTHQIDVDWENGRGLMLVYPIDEFKVIS